MTPTPGASMTEQAETVQPVFAEPGPGRSWVSTARPSHKVQAVLPGVDFAADRGRAGRG